MNKKPYRAPTGAAVMITMFALLMLSSLLVISTIQTVKSETVIVRNQLYNEQAFEAGEAGLEYAYAHLKDNYQEILLDESENSGAGDGFIDAYTTALLNNFDNGHNTQYDISYANSIANNYNIISITSKGSSDQGNTSRFVYEQAAKVPFSTITPAASLITLGSVTLSGNLLIQNLVNDKTLWSGGNISFSGSASTLASNGNGSDRTFSADDISANDPQLTAQSKSNFFKSMLGSDKITTKAHVDLLYNYTTNQNLSSILASDNSNGKSIWISQTSGIASLSGNATIGNSQKPIFLVIDGQFKANGNTEFYGIIYITQDWHNNGGGNLHVHGAVIVEGELSSRGTPSIDYDQEVIDKTMNIAKLTKIPGSWHDF